MRILAALVLVACGKGENQQADDKKPIEMPVGAFAKLRVERDGKPLAIDRAYVRRASPDVYTVVVGAGKGGCEDSQEAGTAFGFTMQKRVAPSGHASFLVTDLWSRDFDVKPALPVKAKLEGNADKGTITTIELPAIADRGFFVEGSLSAAGCGEREPSGLGVPKQPKKLAGTITVAGKALPIRGAIISARKGVEATDTPNLTISTNVKTCDDVTLGAPVMLERKDGTWSLSGTWFETRIEGTNEDTKELAFSANAVGKSADGPTLVLQLSGSGKLGEYNVKLDGTAEAIECVN